VQKDGGASSTLTVANDTSTIKTNIKKLVDAYNAVAKIARDQFSLDPTTGRQGALAGDSTVRGAISRLRSALSGTGGNGAGFLYLSDIGLRFQKDGSLSLDDAKLTSALASNPEGVKNLFLSSQNGIGKRVPAVVDSLINTVSGSLTARQNGITASIASLEKKIDREQQRIAAYQDQLVQQFSSLETLVSGFNQQSQYLSQKLSTTTIK
jgi:flagellar hook-associated protein 2